MYPAIDIWDAFFTSPPEEVLHLVLCKLFSLSLILSPEGVIGLITMDLLISGRRFYCTYLVRKYHRRVLNMYPLLLPLSLRSIYKSIWRILYFISSFTVRTQKDPRVVANTNTIEASTVT